MMPPQIQRHRLKDAQLGSYFGDHYTERNYALDWYIGDVAFGLVTKLKHFGATEFVQVFSRPPQPLIIDLYPALPAYFSQPMNARMSLMTWNGEGRISNNYEIGSDEFHGLLGLLLRDATTHLFVASSNPNGTRPSICTFSPAPPSSELYSPEAIVPVVMTCMLSHIGKTTKRQR